MNARTIALVALAGLGTGALAQSIQTIALTGDAPPLEPGVTFARFSPPRLAPGGQVVFFATLAGDTLDPDFDEAVFSHLNGGISLVVRESDPAPWYAPDTRFVGLSDFAIDAEGFIVLAASIDDPAIDDAPTKARSLGIFAEVAPQTFAPLARTDDQAAGLPDGDLYETLNSPAISPNGQSYFTGGRPDNGLDSYIKGLWTDRTGQTSLLYKPGDPAPGTTDLFATIDTPVPGPGGGYVFRATFRPDGSTDPAAQGLWREIHGALGPVALAGDPAPGTGGAFATFGAETAIDTASAVAFWASTDAGDAGLWTDRSGALALLVREGDAAPGIGGATIRSLSPRPRANDAGDIAFHAALDGVGTSSNGAIYLARDSGEFVLVAREGDALADQAGDVRFLTLGEPTLNAAGHIVFTTTLTGDGVAPASNDALVALRSDGTLRTIIREGDQFNPGDGLRTVRSIFIDASDPARGRSPLDPAGRLGFTLSFTDGSFGVFTSEIDYASPADLDANGIVDIRDFALFLNYWVARDPVADFTGDGNVDTADFIAYLNIWSRDRA